MKSILSETYVESPRSDEALPSQRAVTHETMDTSQVVTKFQKVLVPVALPKPSCASLALARNVAHESGAQLVLLHVVQLNIAGEERGIHRARLLNELCRDAEFQLRQLADSIGGPTAVEIVVREGRPADVIVETARHLKADAIVLCTHGYRGWLKWLRRNTSLHVTRSAPCPVLLISPGKDNFVANLMVVNRTLSDTQFNRLLHRENPNPFQSLARVLFS